MSYLSGWQQKVVRQLASSDTHPVDGGENSNAESQPTPALNSENLQTAKLVPPSGYAIRRFYYTVIEDRNFIGAFFLAIIGRPDKSQMERLRTSVIAVVNVAKTAANEATGHNTNFESVVSKFDRETFLEITKIAFDALEEEDAAKYTLEKSGVKIGKSDNTITFTDGIFEPEKTQVKVQEEGSEEQILNSGHQTDVTLETESPDMRLESTREQVSGEQSESLQELQPELEPAPKSTKTHKKITHYGKNGTEAQAKILTDVLQTGIHRCKISKDSTGEERLSRCLDKITDSHLRKLFIAERMSFPKEGSSHSKRHYIIRPKELQGDTGDIEHVAVAIFERPNKKSEDNFYRVPLKDRDLRMLLKATYLDNSKLPEQFRKAKIVFGKNHYWLKFPKATQTPGTPMAESADDPQSATQV